jgi:hypothetical protein
VRKSVWGAGQWWTTASLVSSVRFQGWLRCQNSRVGVASLGGPYFSSIWRATFCWAFGQLSMICSTSAGSTVSSALPSVSCSPLTV